MDHVRLFVALNLDHAIREEVVQWRQKQIFQPHAVRWVAPENLHFTLAFLGQIPVAGISEISQAIARVVSRQSAFALQLGAGGCFPSPVRPKVLWLGLALGEKEIIALQQEVAREIRDAGVTLEERPFVPHLTLGRVKLGQSLCLPSSWFGPPARAFSAVTVDRIFLMRSDLHTAGAVYTAMAEYRFSRESH